MKVLSRKAFLELPAGTIFAKGKPWYWGPLSRKEETLAYGGGLPDFIYADLVDIDGGHDSGEHSARLDEMLETGTSYPMNADCGRDGCFDSEDLFLVYEEADLVTLRAALTPTPA